MAERAWLSRERTAWPRQAARALRGLARNTARLMRDAAVAPAVALTPREWVVLPLTRGLVEVSTQPRWLGAWSRAPLTVHMAETCLARAASDRKLRGVLLRLGTAPLGWARVASIARQIVAIRERGKLVVVHARAAGNAGAWLGALADHFWMPPHGQLDLIGVRIESPFLREALEHLEARPFVIQAGTYKSAGEILQRSSMSDASRAAVSDVADELYATLRGALARRAGSPERAAEWIDGGPYRASEAHAMGLLDALVYPDEVPRRLRALATIDPVVAAEEATRAAAPAALVAPRRAHAPPAGGEATAHATPAAAERADALLAEAATAESLAAAETDDDVPEARLLSVPAYLRLTRPRFAWSPALADTHAVAVVPVLGMITATTARFTVRLLEALRRSRRHAAVVLRIDSGGGDATASDAIWRSVRRLAERIPVVASMGDTAASGGYYVAMAAREIVAEPTTLTGSIGVVMAGIEVDETLARAGVRFDGVQRGRRAGIYHLSHRRTEDERGRMEQLVAAIYADFLEKVAESRGVPMEQVAPLAEGRVWTGRAAHAHKLVDALGGLGCAVERARALAGLPAGTGDVEVLDPAPRGLARWLAAGDERVATVYDGLRVLLQAPGPRLWCPIQLHLT
jgi:protease-4